MSMFTTANVPERERFARLREVSSKMWAPLDARCEPHLESTFRAQARFDGLGPVQSSLVTSTPLSLHRTPRLIRQADPETLIVTCPVRGRGLVEQGGRYAELQVGDLAIRDSSHPYLTQMAPRDPVGQKLAVQFSRTLLGLPERELSNLIAVRIPGSQGVGALASQFFLQLAQRMDEFSPADAARLSTLALDVLTAALANALDVQNTVPPPTRQRALMAQIRAFIWDDLGNTDLTPSEIAAAHHISVRYLHTLFHQEGHTVAGWIRQRRLERCRRDLAEPRLAARPISAIAARWGFPNPAHFSRAFRSAYGISPRQFRQQSATTHTD